MAAGTKLELKFGTASGIKTWTFNYMMTNLSTASIKTLMNTMITNGDVYRYPPLTRESAKLVTTTETTIDVSGD